eukprot:691748-Prorocentrum_minimum.AAC.1
MPRHATRFFLFVPTAKAKVKTIVHRRIYLVYCVYLVYRVYLVYLVLTRARRGAGGVEPPREPARVG